MSKSTHEVLALPPHLREPPSHSKAVFIDDLFMMSSLDLKKTEFVEIPEDELTRPVPPHQQYEAWPRDILIQDNLNNLVNFTDSRQFEINPQKTKSILFNNRLVHDWLPELTVKENKLENVADMRLLGLIISEDLSWSKNMDNLCRCAYARMYLIRRLVEFGVNTNHIRSLTEYVCVVWSQSLSVKDILKLERTQKVTCRIILAENYRGYEDALESLNLPSLKERRDKLF